MGRSGMPDVEEVGLRTTRGIFARLTCPELLQPGIHIERNGINLLGGSGYLLDVCGVVPGIEDLLGEPGILILPRHILHQVRVIAIHLLGRQALAKHLFPRALHLVAIGIPHLGDGRLERILMGLQILKQTGWHLTLERLVGSIGIVTHSPVGGIHIGCHLVERTKFVFQLDGNDGVLCTIYGLDMTHQF